MSQVSPGWYPDPSGRFAQRYHDGTRWTEHVADASGQRSVDHPEGQGAAPAANPYDQSQQQSGQGWGAQQQAQQQPSGEGWAAGGQAQQPYGQQQAYGQQQGYGQPSSGQWGAQPGYGQPYGSAPQPTKALSITSMVLGLAGLVLGFMTLGLLSIAAVITGHIAAKKEPYARGFWLTGLICGYAAIAIGAILLVFYIILLATYPTLV